MNEPANPPETSRRSLWLAGGLLVLAGLVAYANTFFVPFLFDDRAAITDNATIRELWPLSTPLSPPQNGSGVTGRPLVNLSLAVNHAVSGGAVWSYHALNLLIHLGAGLALFGLVRRTLRQPVIPAALRADALPAGFVIAALWLLHPLLTESVTSLIQRTESQMGLCYLLTLYGFIRGIQSPRSAGWLALSVAACLLGMATKEVMVSAPLVVFLFDRTFVAGTFREAWRQRRRYYLGLAATWLLLGWLVLGAGGTRGSVAGFGLGVTPWTYALTQCPAILLYLKLSVWPDPLVFDYGTGVVRQLPEVGWQAVVLLLLLAGTGWALVRRPVLGFLGAWFFVILAPSSSFVPLVTQTMAEHRMYLPLAAVLVVLVAATRVRFGRAALGAGLVVAAGFAVLTVLRNRDYRSGLVLWTDTVAKVPDSPRAHFNLAGELEKDPDRQDETLAQYEEALQLNPDFAEAHVNLAINLARIPDRLPEAIAHCKEAIRLQPDMAMAHNNLANYLVRTPGRLLEGLAQYEQALRLKPDDAVAHCNYANRLVNLPGRRADALAHYEAAVRLKPDYAQAHHNLGLLLAALGRLDEAASHLETAVQLSPDDASARINLDKIRARLAARK